MPTPPAYSGSIPENYDRYFGPYIFEPFALDLAARVPADSRRVLEIACGTGRVTAQFGLMFIPDQLKALREAYRVLRPGGKLLLSTWDKLDNGD